MKPFSTRDRWTVAGVALACAAASFYLFRGLRFDDAYITLQFARNVGRGHGFVFNDSQRVFGSTSPLHVLLLAGVYALAGDVLAPAAILIGTVAVAAQAVLLFLLLEKTSRPLAWLVSGVVLAGFVNSYLWLTLETNLLAALVLGGTWAIANRREWLAGILLGLSFLCRYDAVLLVPISVCAWWLTCGVIPKRLLIVSVAIVAPWLTWAALYFGSVMPQTFYAKQHITPPFLYFSTALLRFQLAPWLALPVRVQSVLALFSPLAWVSGALFVWYYARHLIGLVIYGVALLLAYSWIGPFTTQSWHLYLAELTFALLFLLGTAGWLLICPPSSAVRVLSSSIVSASFLLSSSLQTGHFASTYTTELWVGQRQNRYVAIAAWLRESVRPDSIVLAPEVGTIGYLSELRMVDPFGLINVANNYTRDQSTENLAELARWYHPDVVVVDSPDRGAVFEQRTAFRIVKVYEWDPWSTVLVRGPEVLNRPSDFDELRAALPERARVSLQTAAP